MMSPKSAWTLTIVALRPTKVDSVRIASPSRVLYSVTSDLKLALLKNRGLNSRGGTLRRRTYLAWKTVWRVSCEKKIGKCGFMIDRESLKE